MKNLLLLAILPLMLACNNKAENKKSETTSNENVPKVQEIKKIDAVQQIIKDSLDISFIGKTTIELNKYHFHECFGTALYGKNENEKFAVSKYSKIIDNCNEGKNKIILEKLINYYDGGKANFEIVDEMNVITSPKKYYNTISLKLDSDKEEQDYLIEYEDNNKETITKIFKIWKIDLEKQKFIEIKVPQNFTCNNPEYAEEEE